MLQVEFQDTEDRTICAILTTDHSGSRYGQPVLLVNGRDFGPGDLPGLTGEPLTILYAIGSGPVRTYQSPDNPAVMAETRLTEAEAQIVEAARAIGFEVVETSILRRTRA